jgi:hypothetical protein
MTTSYAQAPLSYASKTIQALLLLATKSVKVWQQTGLRLSWNVIPDTLPSP